MIDMQNWLILSQIALSQISQILPWKVNPELQEVKD